MKGIYSVGGKLIFHNPGPEMEPILSELDPSFRIQSIQPPKDFVPKFQALRKKKVSLDQPLLDLSPEDLKTVLNEKELQPKKKNGGQEYSLLQVAHASSLSLLSRCNLCGWNCGVNRFVGEKGRCGLGSAVSCLPSFIHIAEEPVINPAVVTNLGGCALRCQYCIDHQVWDPSGFPALDVKAFWQEVQALMIGNTRINTLEFTNPTESLAGVIEILSQAPPDFNSPVVFNCHLYGSKEFYELAFLVTDVWLPDLRYGNDDCAKRLSKVDHYMEYAKLGLNFLASEEARVIVRVLVLPGGHVNCCHKPAIELLSRYRDRVWVSVLDQYVPEYQAYLDPELKRRPTRTEIEEVKALVERDGLKDICSGEKDFWVSPQIKS